VRTNASDAARENDAGPEAAAGGGQCAATVALIDGTLHLVRGCVGFKAPAKELHWKDDVRAELVVSPKALGPIEQLKQELEQAKGAGRVEAHCLQLAAQMEPKITSDSGLGIKWHDNRKQYVRRDTRTIWRWDISASERGRHPLDLNVTAYVSSPLEAGGLRSIEDPLFDDYINVRATAWELSTDFVARNWPVLVPILTILTAIVFPYVVPWWKRRNQPSAPRDRSSEPDDQRWI
jgi:hypothetical protein